MRRCLTCPRNCEPNRVSTFNLSLGGAVAPCGQGGYLTCPLRRDPLRREVGVLWVGLNDVRFEMGSGAVDGVAGKRWSRKRPGSVRRLKVSGEAS
jgi:hypothetical protein